MNGSCSKSFRSFAGAALATMLAIFVNVAGGAAPSLHGTWRAEWVFDGDCYVSAICLEPAGKYSAVSSDTPTNSVAGGYDPRILNGATGTWSLRDGELRTHPRAPGDTFGPVSLGTISNVTTNTFTTSLSGAALVWRRLPDKTGETVARFARQVEAWKYSEKGAQYWGKAPEMGEIALLLRPENGNIPLSKVVPSSEGLKLLRVGMSAAEVTQIMPRLHRWQTYPWGRAEFYPTGMSHGWESTADEDFTPLVFDKSKSLLGWGAPFLEARLMLEELKPLAEKILRQPPSAERNLAALPLLRTGMTEKYVRELLPNPGGWHEYLWGKVLWYPTVANPAPMRPDLGAPGRYFHNATYRPVIFGPDGKLIGSGWELFDQKTKLEKPEAK